MTVSSANRKAGPFLGNGVATTFVFNYKVFKTSDVAVTFTDANGTDTLLVLDNQYSVTLNTDQDNNPGGTVTYPRVGSGLSVLPVGSKITLTGSLAYTQPTDLPNPGPFFASVVEDAFDRAEIQIQQLAEVDTRTIKVGISDTPPAPLPAASVRSNTVLGFDALGNLITLPLPSSIGAGDRVAFTLAAGTDFTPGVSTQVTLPRPPGAQGNLELFFDPLFQGFDQWSVAGQVVTFTAPIPVGVTKIFGYVGTTLSTQVPPVGSVGDSQVVASSRLGRRLDMVEVRDFGAVGNGASNDSAAFATVVPHMFVLSSGLGDYRVSANATVSADLTFIGGAITVDSGVTLTINGSIRAPSKVIFKGAGTVVINTGVIDVAWFDGADASTKTVFCFRGIQNTNGTGKAVAYYPPSPDDAWATQSANLQWGYGWKVAAPIAIEQVQTYTLFLTYSSFIATAAMDAMFTIGAGATKADGVNFPVRLKTDGGNGLATWAVRMYGTSHTYIPYCELYYSGGIYMSPNGVKQVSDVQIGFMDTGALYGPALVTDGAAGANNGVTDVEVGFVNSTGFVTGHAAAALCQIGSNSNGITIRKVSHRAVVAGTVDATTAIVLITNAGASGPNAISPRYGIKVGPVFNGSLVPTAQAIVTADASSGSAALMTGICLEAGSEVDSGSPPGGSSISLNYTSGAIVQGMPGPSATNGVGQKVTVNATCVNTRIYGMLLSNIADAGIDTLVDGHNKGAITAVSAPGSGVGFVNNRAFHVLYTMTGATAITNVAYTRGASTVNIAANVGTTGSWMLAPGDNIAVSYTGSPSFSYIPM